MGTYRGFRTKEDLTQIKCIHLSVWNKIFQSPTVIVFVGVQNGEEGLKKTFREGSIIHVSLETTGISNLKGACTLVIVFPEDLKENPK